MARERQTKVGQREATTAELVRVARRLFSDRGYSETSTEEIVERAGVTRGALYHHFANKEGLFRAVLEAVQRDVAGRVALATAGLLDPWEQLRAGCRAFLAASLEPDVQRIMLIDAPAVVGWEVWRAADARHSMRSLREGLAELVAQGLLTQQPVEPLAHLLSGAMNEAALWIARSPDPVQALAEASTALDRLLDGLRSG